MTEIANIVRNAFTKMRRGERNGLQLTKGERREFYLLGNRRRGLFQLNQAQFSNIDEGIFTEFEKTTRRRTLDTKSKCIEMLSASDDFSQLARIPDTHTISYRGLIVPGLEDVPLSALLKMDIMIVESKFEYPVFVKPDDGTSGLLACSVYNQEALLNALKAIFNNTESKRAVVQEKIEIDREYRCVYFNERAYLLFDRMFKERGIENGRASQAKNRNVSPKHIRNKDAWQQAQKAVQIIAEASGIDYFAADFATDTNGHNWFIETNCAPSLSFAYQGKGIEQMKEMACDMIAYVRE